MCRLMGYVGAPLSPRHLVFGGEHPLYEQAWAPRELLSGSVNADGYGIVWYKEGVPARIAETRPIWYDDQLPSTLAAFESGCILAALRNGTPGIPVDRSGLLPLVHDRWGFVLNGFVPDFRASHMRTLRAELPDDLYAALRGSTDSETLFLLTVSALRDGATPVDALTATAARVLKRVGDAPCQLNMVLSDGESLSAVRLGSELVTNSLYVAFRPPFAPDGVVLASEVPEGGAVWEPVDGHGSVVIHADGSIEKELVFLD